MFLFFEIVVESKYCNESFYALGIQSNGYTCRRWSIFREGFARVLLDIYKAQPRLILPNSCDDDHMNCDPYRERYPA